MPSVVIPWTDPGDGYRLRALKWVLEHYQADYPTWEIQIVEGNGGPWCKGALVQQGVREAKSEAVIVADADVWTTGLVRGVMAVTAGIADWAVPHRRVHRLTRQGTNAVLGGARWRDQPAERPYEGRRGGGYVIASRETLLEIPMDKRFVGWGQEDESWDYALRCLVGEPFRGNADLVHLWHPKPERVDRRKGSNEGWRLMKRYAYSRDDPEKMRELLKEAS